MSAKKSAKPSEPAGYAEALSELELILSEIDSPNVDVDVLSERVARASFLISWCKERIDSAQFSIDEIVASLDSDDDAGFDDDDDDADDEDDDDDDDTDDDDDEYDDD
jgi:exodeoxyribonuclease VII small subunit